MDKYPDSFSDMMELLKEKDYRIEKLTKTLLPRSEMELPKDGLPNALELFTEWTLIHGMAQERRLLETEIKLAGLQKSADTLLTWVEWLLKQAGMPEFFYQEIKMLSEWGVSCPEGLKGRATLDRWFNEVVAQIDKQSLLNQGSEPGFIYLLYVDDFGLHKIGKSVNPESRAKGIMGSLPMGYELLHTIQTDEMARLETFLHHKYAEYRQKGEWFHLPSDAVEYIKTLQDIFYSTCNFSHLQKPQP